MRKKSADAAVRNYQKSKMIKKNAVDLKKEKRKKRKSVGRLSSIAKQKKDFSDVFEMIEKSME